jgi:hypothetical protein
MVLVGQEEDDTLCSCGLNKSVGLKEINDLAQPGSVQPRPYAQCFPRLSLRQAGISKLAVGVGSSFLPGPTYFINSV